MTSDGDDGKSHDSEDGPEGDWFPLDVRLSQAEFLAGVMEALDLDDEVWGIRFETVRLDDVDGEPTFVVELQVNLELGMVAAERRKSNADLQAEFFLRTNTA